MLATFPCPGKFAITKRIDGRGCLFLAHAVGGECAHSAFRVPCASILGSRKP